MNAYLYPQTYFRSCDVTTVTLDDAVYEVCADLDDESQGGEVNAQVYAIKLGGKWHSYEALAADFVLALNKRLTEEVRIEMREAEPAGVQ